MYKYTVIQSEPGLYLVTVKNHGEFLNHKEGLYKTPIVGFCVGVDNEHGESYLTPLLIDSNEVDASWIIFDEKKQHWYSNYGARGCTEEGLYRYVMSILKNDGDK